MTIKKNPIISFNKDERDSIFKIYQWLCDMDEDDFGILGEVTQKKYPNFDIYRLFNLLEDLKDFIEDCAE